MIRLVTAAGLDLVLPAESVQIDVDNPFFSSDSIPGTATHAFDLPWTRANLRGLNFPDRHRGPGGPPPVLADLYLDGQLWRRGRLLYREVDAVKQRLRYNFVADAADLASQIKDVRLPDLALGTVALQRQARTGDYALLPVANVAFFGDPDKAPADYQGVLNYCSAAGTYPPTAYLAPQPYLVPLLRKVLGLYGYDVVGTWVQDAEIQQLVVYSDRVLPAGATTVVLNRQVPNITIPALLVGLQQLFCLGYHFDVARRQVRIEPLRDVLAGGAYRDRRGTRQRTVANATNGFVLRQNPDGNDALDKTLDTGWQELRLGAGGEVQEAAAGTMHLATAPDALVPARRWLLPAIESKGAVPGNADVGDESRTGLRLLFDRGQQPDSQGATYPLGSPLTQNLADRKSVV